MIDVQKMLWVRQDYLHTPHFPPSFAQCLQYRQFLHALPGVLSVHLAKAGAIRPGASIPSGNVIALTNRIVARINNLRIGYFLREKMFEFPVL